MKTQARIARVDPPVVAKPVETPKPRVERPSVIQRKCGCAGGAGSCECDEEQKVQRKARGPARPAGVPPEVQRTLSSPGTPLRADVREQMEGRFGHDFGAVRVHVDAASARSVNARAYTAGSHIVFDGASSMHEPRLLAHELTHVVQQRSGTFAAARTISDPGDAHEREADAVADRVTAGASAGLIVPASSSAPIRRMVLQREAAPIGEELSVRPLILEDTVAELQQGQMTKTEFLAQLEYTVCAAADESLRRAGRTVDGCPYVTFWFNYYRDRSAEQLERAIRKFAPESTLATDAFEYIPIVADRVRVAVDVWATTGVVTGVPDAAEIAESGMPAGGVGGLSCPAEESSSPDGIMPKALPGGLTPNADPKAIKSQLGAGRSLDGGARSRMERAFGYDFSNVRLHTGARAAAASSSLNARAFTIGSDIAFGAGEYKPGTLVGDAILAHELAHVVQQSGASPTTAHKKRGASEYGSLEEDADRSAVGAVVSLWTGAKGHLADLARDAMPRLRSGLGLQRCFGCKSGDKKAEEVKEKVADDGGTPEDAAPVATPIPKPAETKCKSDTDPDKVVTEFRVEPKVIEQPGDEVTFTASFSCIPVGDGFSQFVAPDNSTFEKKVFGAGLKQFTRKWGGKKLYDKVGTYMVDDGNYQLELLPFKYAYKAGKDVMTSGSMLKSEAVKVNVGAFKGTGTDHPHYTPANAATLANVIRTEMGGQNDAEKRAVAWSVRNQMLRVNTGDAATAVKAFKARDDKAAEPADVTMAEEILKKPMTDGDNKTQGTIKWFSPWSQPVEDDCKKGKEGCDEVVTFKDVAGVNQKRWAPGFHRTMTYVPITGVRPWYARFYKL
jgi:hypothetical protein